MHMIQASQAPFEQWVETAHHLGQKSASSVACPCCGSTSLSVRDVEYGFGHEKGVQRYISCGCCGAFTGVNVKRAGENELSTLRAAE
jgi:formate dehydrogenase maturation protein FdhE